MYNAFVKITAYAKLNLSLNVTGKKNGFHLLDSVVLSVSVFDKLTLTPRQDKTVTISDGGLLGENNVAYKAAVDFTDTFNTTGIDLTVEKGIPMLSGMGGSSACAAGVIVGLSKLYNVNDEEKLYALACRHGSDTVCQMHGGLVRMRGRGEIVERIPFGKRLYFVVMLFDEGLSTKEVFLSFDCNKTHVKACDNDKLIYALTSGNTDGIQSMLSNQLEEAALVSANAKLKNEYASLDSFCIANGMNKPQLTGSGSAKFLVFSNEKQAQNCKKLLYEKGFKAIVCHSVDNGVAFEQ